MALRTLLPVALFALFTPALHAHGGQYRGPWNAPPIPVSGTGIPLGPTTGPTTGGRPSISDGTSWQVWWEFSKDPLLEETKLVQPSVLSGSAEYFLGQTSKSAATSADAIGDVDRRDLIAKALAAMLASTSNRDIATACMIALAKVGVDPDGVSIRQLFAARVGDGDQEVRESAALALGIAGQRDAVDLLAQLVADRPAGRKLAGGEVPERTRTFAAWGLGLLAARADTATRQRAHDALLAVLRDKELKSRDLRVGVIEGLGLLRCDPKQPAEKWLLWQTVDELWQYYDLDLGKGDQLLQAHVPIAVARLLGRGQSAEHQRAKRRLLEALSGRIRRHNAIYQSAAMALGSLCLPEDVCAEDAACREALLRYYQSGTDQLTRFFGVLAMGRIGGDANRTALLGVYRTANRAIERPWAALALGLVARQQLNRDGGKVDDEIGRMLHKEFVDFDNFDAQSALALAIGLCGYQPAAEALHGHLDDGTMNDMLVGYAAIGLAMLDHKKSSDKLLEVMQSAQRRPFVLQQCAIALGQLGDRRVVPVLQGMLGKSESAAVLSAVAMALGEVGDRRSIEPLIAAMQDKDRPRLAQAFAAAALGAIGDKDPLPWNTAIAVGMNYMATVDTLTNGSTGVLDIL